MLNNTKRFPESRRTIGHPYRPRQCRSLSAAVLPLALIAATLLGSCSGSPVRLAQATAPGGGGFIAVDEPRAARVGRDVLLQGGNAVDAAVAVGLALSVTLPSRAGLGGGGVCLIRPGSTINTSLLGIRRAPKISSTEAVEFLPRAPREGATIGMPALARGLFALHAKYGRERWEQLVAPGENLARFGMTVSRSLIHDIEAAKAEISGPNGKPLAEGDTLPQGDLANVMALLRQHGANGFYGGEVAAAIVAGSGGVIDEAALRNYAPQWSKPEGVALGNDRLYFTPGPGGAFAEQVWTKVNGTAGASFFTRVLRSLGAGSKVDVKAASTNDVAVADAAAALLPPGAPPPDTEGDAATGFVVVDNAGEAVACSLTIGRRFGAGQALGRSGILASRPVPQQSDGLSGAALLWVNDNDGKFLAGFASGGDRAGSQALVETLTNLGKDREALDGAMTAPRLYAAGPGTFLAEPGLDLAGHQATEAPTLSIVNAVVCPTGMPVEKPDCIAGADPRSTGVGATVRR
jgi:gamma-glutamyltranspeptidase/glutathione hydrolase